ncbi:MAG: 2-C-methyl-D-erythritol 4-phosphate cytidylyltransferase [Prevotella sp.]
MDHVIIVAGGKGLRMGGEIPKQFMLLGCEPILMRTIRCFHDYSPELDIILVLPADQQDYWRELCRKYWFNIKVRIANGGDTRYQSVRNGLAMIGDDEQGVVAIHDGVRPLLTVDLIERCFDGARQFDMCIPVIPVTDTLYHVGEGNVPRSEYRLVQTPQCFPLRVMRKAYNQPFSESFTDDASVCSEFAESESYIEGEATNIKITRPIDLILAEAIFKGKLNKPNS